MFNRNKQRREMAAEFAHRIALRAEELIRSGVSKDEAHRRARAEFGSVANYQEQGRQARGWLWFDDLIADLRYAFRTYKASPGFTAVAIIILAAAIGANTVLFTFYNELILKPMPIADSANHVVFRNAFNIAGSRDRFSSRKWSRAEFELLQSSLSRYRNFYASEIVDAPMREPLVKNIRINYVSAGYMNGLAAPILLGRPMNDAEPDSVVVSYSTWQNVFQGDPAVIGKKLLVGGEELTVVAVAGASFTGVLPWSPDLWAPLKPGMGKTRSFAVGAFGPAADLAHLAPALNDANGGAIRYQSVDAASMPTYTLPSPELDISSALVFAAFFLLVVIACANLANLLLARAAARSREISIRLSLGAPRARIIRQLLTESVLLAVTASAVGLALVVIAIPFVHRFLFAIVASVGFHVNPPEPDWRVFLYTAAVAIAAGILFGLVPALESTKPQSNTKPRWRSSLIVVQVAASTLLLTLASVFVLDARRLSKLDPGFDLAPLVHLDAKRNDKLRAAIEQDSRFASISFMHRTPLWTVLPQLPARSNDRALSLGFGYIDDRYFETLGIGIVQGRDFRRADLTGQSTAVVVSQMTARKLWPAANPIGQTLEVVADSTSTRYVKGRYEVVGVAADVTTGFLFQGRDSSAVYFPAKPGDDRDRGIVVRAAIENSKAIEALRQICANTDPTLLCEVRPLSLAAWGQTYPFTIAAGVAAGLGIVALVLTCIGLYGLVGYAVVQRTREIGIRMALGSTQSNILRLLVGQTSKRVLAGVIIGLPMAIGAIVAAKSLIFMETGSNIVPFAATPIVLIAVATLAAAVPARKATQIDPASALRHD